MQESWEVGGTISKAQTNPSFKMATQSALPFQELDNNELEIFINNDTLIDNYLPISLLDSNIFEPFDLDYKKENTVDDPLTFHTRPQKISHYTYPGELHTELIDTTF